MRGCVFSAAACLGRRAPFAAGTILLLAPVASALAQPAVAVANPPATGTVVQDSGLRQQLEQYFSRTTPPTPDSGGQPAWTVTPSINLEQDWTDHATQIDSNKPSFITVIRPALNINGQTSRLKATLNYAPDIEIYEPESSQTRLGNNLNADALVTLLPETLFVDFRALATVQALNSGTAPNSVSTLSRDNTVQTYTGSVSPYLQHRFEDWGSGEIGAGVSRTTQNTLGGSSDDGSADENLTTTTEHALFNTGNNFGRSTGQVTAQGSQYSGSGALAGAYRYQAGVQYGYGITRQVTALGQVGWESIYYSGVTPYRVDDATWSFGGRWTPQEDSNLTLTFGHHDGANSFSGNVSLPIAANGRLFGTYSQGVTSDSQDLQDTLAAASLDPYGNPVNPVNGAPLLVGSNQFGAVGGGTVYRLTRMSIGYSILLPRDTISFNVLRELRNGITGPTLSQAELQSTDTNGSVSWQHLLTENLSLSFFFQYGVSESNQTLPETTHPLAASTTLSRSLTETLSVYARYTYSQGSQNFLSQNFQNSEAPQATEGVNLVAVGLLKTF